MRGSMNVLETIGPGGQKGPRLFGDVGRMIVQNQPNRVVGRVVGVEILQQGDKLPAPMAPFNVSRHMAGMQIQSCQDGASSQPLILMVASKGGVLTWNRWQVGGDVG